MILAPNGRSGRRRFLAPEVVQTSAMDCGPAALKCLVEGHGVPISYGRLREACQTEVDGTSIETLEGIARHLGLDAAEEMLPLDHLFTPEARALPAIVVVRLPNGFAHFVVLWRRHGPWAQVMDPSVGRRWMTARRFLDEVFVHEMQVSATDWRAWAGTDEFLHPLAGRLRQLGLPGAGEREIHAAIEDSGWRSLAALDASARMVSVLMRSGGLARGGQTVRAVRRFFGEALDSSTDQAIPSAYWSARGAPSGPDGEERLLLRGCVVVRVRGHRASDGTAPSGDAAAPCPPEVVAALREPPSRPGRALLRLLRQDGLLVPSALSTALVLAAGGAMVEAFLFRSLLDIGRDLHSWSQRVGMIGALLILLVALAVIDLSAAAGVLDMGRRLEIRLRKAFLEKIPRLGDRYFRSRPLSDMADRSHCTHGLRMLPDIGSRLLRHAMELTVTTAGIVWIHPSSAGVAVLAAVIAVALPLAAQTPYAERDLRARTHAGGLARFYLDSLLGLTAVRSHGAERAVRREHESLLVEWVRAGRSLLACILAVEGASALIGLALATWIFLGGIRAGEPGALLLLYWALQLPVLGQEIALLARQYPAHRNVTLRLLEPLGALEDAAGAVDPRSDDQPLAAAAVQPARGVAIAFDGVHMIAGGHRILADLDLTIAAGSHVAIIGPSGAGKSSLLGLLLGWNRATGGRIRIDGVPLTAAGLAGLRAQTAWLDPAVQLWNRALLDNLLYGVDADSVALAQIVEDASLAGVLAGLPGGLSGKLGEGGGLVSGGEGQRIRFGRALARRLPRLVILDEPFRGLDRPQRRRLLARARACWSGATLLCATHDVGETMEFERVLVIEAGRVVEDDSPRSLAARSGSRYRDLLDAEKAVRDDLWASSSWRRVTIDHGQLAEDGRTSE